jgi:hypothetical protein
MNETGLIPLVGPVYTDRLFGAGPPDRQPGWHDANDRAHSSDAGLKRRMTKKTPNKMGHLVLADGKYDQTVSRMAKAPVGEAQIARKECGMGDCQEKRENVLIADAFARQLHADLATGNPPASQQLALTLQDVFIQDIHAIRGLSRQFIGMFPEQLTSRTHRLCDRLFVYAPAPLFHDAFPGHPACNLLKHVRNQNTRAAKCRPSVANLRICHNITAYDFLSHPAAMHTPPRIDRQRNRRDQSRMKNL